MLFFYSNVHAQKIIITSPVSGCSNNNSTTAINSNTITATVVDINGNVVAGTSSSVANVNWFVIYDSRVPQVSFANPISITWCYATDTKFQYPWTGSIYGQDSPSSPTGTTNVVTSPIFYSGNCFNSCFGYTDVMHLSNCYDGTNGYIMANITCQQGTNPIVQGFANGTYQLMCIIGTEFYYSDYFSVITYDTGYLGTGIGGPLDLNLDTYTFPAELSTLPGASNYNSYNDYYSVISQEAGCTPTIAPYQYIFTPGSIYASEEYFNNSSYYTSQIIKPGGLVSIASGQKLRFKSGSGTYLYPGFMASKGSDVRFESGTICQPVNQSAPFTASNYRLMSPSTPAVDSTVSLSNGVSIFPNPTTSGLFTIQSQNAVTINISNLLGQEVYKSSVTVSKQEVDLSNIGNGVYLVQTTGSGKTTTQKVIVNK
jgi:hypothetical protein